jgi:hypothetical protein
LLVAKTSAVAENVHVTPLELSVRDSSGHGDAFDTVEGQPEQERARSRVRVAGVLVRQCEDRRLPAAIE